MEETSSKWMHEMHFIALKLVNYQFGNRIIHLNNYTPVQPIARF